MNTSETIKGVPKEYHDFKDVFDLQEARKMPKDRGVWNFKIDFVEGWENKLPKPAKRYRLSMEEQELEKETIKELLEAGMIRPSTSPIAAPCFFVPKKDGTKRHVVDWRGINSITMKDAHPLPIMDDLLDLARGSKVMSKLDLTASYNQIPIREQDRWKTAFISSQGLFEFNVMHFGFANAPPHMQRFMQHTLSPVYHEMVRVYLDDIPVFSKGTPAHIKHHEESIRDTQEEQAYLSRPRNANSTKRRWNSSESKSPPKDSKWKTRKSQKSNNGNPQRTLGGYDLS
jgi:hypothetical protein